MNKEYYRDYFKKRRERLKKEGICVNCTKNKAEKDHVLCDDCLRDRREKAMYNNTMKRLKHDIEIQNIQEGKCAICGSDMRIKNLDHDHSNGHIRAYLCTSCNTGLGLFKDSSYILARAITYLESFKK